MSTEERGSFHYKEVCNGCLRHLYDPPKHFLLIGGCFVRFCDDDCLKAYRKYRPELLPALRILCANAIIKTPELYDISLLPDECKRLINQGLGCKKAAHVKLEGRCYCKGGWDCFMRVLPPLWGK
jgi:hypothetical protein